jgi:hypothetical protein
VVVLEHVLDRRAASWQCLVERLRRIGHYRKGVAGDWRIHFTSVHIAAFKARYGDLLVKLGYEVDDHW